MNNVALENIAVRCRQIGGPELGSAASLASVAAQAFPGAILPVIEHALCSDLWNHISRAIARGNFDQAHAAEAAALYAEVSARALELRAELGWLTPSAQGAKAFPPFAAEMPLPLAAATIEAAAAPLQDALTAEGLLASPSASFWLRGCLASALERDPVDVANDAEVLARVLTSRADAHNATQAARYGTRGGC